MEPPLFVRWFCSQAAKQPKRQEGKTGKVKTNPCWPAVSLKTVPEGRGKDQDRISCGRLSVGCGTQPVATLAGFCLLPLPVLGVSCALSTSG